MDQSGWGYRCALPKTGKPRFTLTKQASKQGSVDSRSKVAREAAALLYFGLEKEYRQAKLKAAENLGLHVLPSNLEVALELDRLAGETEGSARTGRLIQMRFDALEIMKMLKLYSPLLIGSTWRGNVRRGSDIDIEVYHDKPQEIVALLKEQGLTVLRTEAITVTEHGETCSSLHVYVESRGKHAVEIVVRSVEEAGKKRLCDTFGDEIRGLRISELEKLLAVDAAQRFLP